MSDDPYKIGDTVREKSGGPLMIVETVEEDGSCGCVWFEKNRPNRGLFSNEDLMPDDGSSGIRR